jgi:site-specific recombinase XerC
MLRAPLPTALNYNLAIHSNDSFWTVQKDQASLSAVLPTTPRRPVQTGRLHGVHGWVDSAGLDSSAYGTHSMHRTKAAQIYKKTGNLRAVQLLLGHTKLESTVRYLGIEVDDALSISEQVEL